MGKQITPHGWRIEKAVRNHASAAILHNLHWELTDEDARDILTSPCHYCGCMPVVPYPGFVDRLDPSVDYVFGNCVPSCKICISSKGDRCEQEYIAHCKLVASHIDIDDCRSTTNKE